MADNDIIDFYKKADNDNKPEEPLKEQVETPEPVVSEAVSIPAPESNDPFDKFLFNLAEKLKTEKKITEQQQQQFNERVVKPTTNPEDPFAKFLESFAGLVKEDENINKEENIKEATIDFINKLKNDDFFDYKKEEPKEEVKPESKKKPKKYLPPKFVKKIEKVEEDIPVIEQSTEPEPELTSNPYLKELQSTDKKKSKVEDKISGLSDIKKIIAQQVQEQLSKYPNIGFTGGGGGTNAVQYALGGTMNGDLTVNGTVNASTYLSGGVNLANLLSSSGGGGGFADRFVSGPSQFILDPDGKLHPLDNDLLTLQSENATLSAYTRIVLSPYGFFAYDNNSNSITFDSISDDIIITSQDLYEWTFSSEGKLVGPSGTLAVSGNVDVTNKFLSGGKDLLEIFALSGTGGGGTGREDVNTLVISNSANWNTAYNTATAYSSVSGSFVNNTTLNSVSSVLLPTTVYQSTSGQFALSAHASTHFTGGRDAITPSNISAQWQQVVSSQSIVTDTVLLSGRNRRININALGNNLNITLPSPTAGNLNGDIITIVGSSINSPLTIRRVTLAPFLFYTTLATINAIGQSYTFVYGNDNLWALSPVDTHTHTASQITGLNYLPLSGGTITGNLSVSGTSTFTGTISTLNGTSSQWNSTATTVQSNSSNWQNAYNTATVYQSNSASYATTAYTDATYLPLSGGTLTGNLSVYGNTFINNNLTIGGNLTALGTATFANTIFTTTSALSVYNTGPGPALYVYQASGPYDVASFYDGDGIEVLHVGNAGPGGFGKVGVNESFPNEELTVRGSISATDTIYANSYLSAGVNLLDIFTGGGGGGGGVTTTKKFDYVTVSNIDYSYSGTAVQGTLETSPTWKLIRLTYANNGTISNSASAIDSWTGRLTATYV